MVCLKGVAAFVYPQYNNKIYAIVSGDCAELNTCNKDQERLIIPHCGFEDTVMNHLDLVKDIEESSTSDPSPQEIGR
jgi:hypothetical protein